MTLASRIHAAALAAAALAAPALPAHAAQIFLSDSATDPTPENPTFALTPGGTATAYLWVLADSDEVLNGLTLDVTASTPGVVGGVSAVIHNPTAFVDRTGPVLRWQGTGTGVLGEVVAGLAGVAVTTGTGIDGRFDEDANPFFVAGPPRAFLFATLGLEGLAEGATDVFIRVGENLISERGVGAGTIFFGAGETAPIVANTAGLTGTIADATVNVVPEPSTALLAAAGVVGLVARRRATPRTR